MAAEQHDIFANVSRTSGATSTGALAVYLARSCGHVLVDSRVIQQGYRFHPELGEEIPAFFNRRISTGSSSVSITLQAGVDPERWNDDPLEACRTTADARAVVEADDYHASLWLARITVGVAMMDVRDVADPLFLAKHPNEFRVIAEELVALGVLQSHACALCRAGDDEADD